MSYYKRNGLGITYLYSICLISNIVLINPAYAVDSWSMSVTPQVLAARYSDSTLRNSMLALGVFAKADYLEKGSLALGYNFTSVVGTAGNPDIDESSWYASGRYVRYSDTLAGKLGIRLDGYAIKDQTKIEQPGNDTGMGHNQGQGGSSVITLTDDVGVIYGQLDYVNYGDRFYADVGYARSEYDYELNAIPYLDNTVQQFTTAAGLALNNHYDYLQTRIYLIRLKHGDNTNGMKQSNALEFKWLHWYKANALLNTHSSFIKVVTGKRLFPVDPDAAVTYSIADLQTTSASAGLDWKIGENGKLLFVVGYDRYENLNISDKYSQQYLYSSFALTW